MARWQDPICPVAIGLSQEQDAAVVNRIKKTATTVGAPVRPDGCRTNIVIIFAAKPQELLDEIARHYTKYRSLIGDVDGPSHARYMAQVKSPVQAWYGTEIKDVRGNRIATDCYGCSYYSNGSRLSNGVSSVFTNVFVVVNLSKAVGFEVGTMADYVAMLALSQAKSFDTCRELPSITNLLSPDCVDALKAKALSEADIAYLRGVYKMNPDEGLNLARSDIYDEIDKNVGSTDVKAPTNPPVPTQ